MSVEDKNDVASEKVPSSMGSCMLSTVPCSSLRERNFLVGHVSASKALLVDELNVCFPDKKAQIFVGTWNMQRCPVPTSVSDFILASVETVRDVYVIGVQEATANIKQWEIKMQETLGTNHVLINSTSHGVLHVAVFVRRDLIWFCSDFQSGRVTTRLISQVKTKGAVAISFRLFGTHLLFISSHFHSGETKVKERIEDYYKIADQLKLPITNGLKNGKETARYDGVFWFGDLNFRINQPHQFMKQEVEDPSTYNIREALKCDQLKRNMERGKVFHGFQEDTITFLPTYKFTPGSDKYDSSMKLRVPSYTDRILHRAGKNTSIHCYEYDCVQSVQDSDHRPVYALFEIGLKPGKDSAPLGTVSFNHNVYMEAAKRRAHCSPESPQSAVCTLL